MLIDRSGRFIEYLLARKDVAAPWKEHTEHDFVRQIGDGTLPVNKFKMYLIQDYLYLVSGEFTHQISWAEKINANETQRSSTLVPTRLHREVSNCLIECQC